MSKQYKPRVIKCRCNVCKEFIADFIVPYLLAEAYCWDCWKKEMENNSDLELIIASKKFLTENIKKSKRFKSRWLKQQTEDALMSIQNKIR